MATVLVRPGRRAELESIERVFVEAVRVGWAPIFGRERLYAELPKLDLPEWEMAGTSVLVAEKDGGVVGFTSFGPPYGEGDGEAALGKVYRLFVLPAEWGGGVGTALLESTVAALAHAGYGAAVLWVAEANEPARTFYEHRGWKSNGQQRLRTFLGVEYGDVRYRRSLKSGPELAKHSATVSSCPPGRPPIP